MPRRVATSVATSGRIDRYACRPHHVHMRSATGSRLKRKSFFVDEGALRRARRALGAKTDAEVVRASIERVAEMEAFWKLMTASRRTLRRGSIETP